MIVVSGDNLLAALEKATCEKIINQTSAMLEAGKTLDQAYYFLCGYYFATSTRLNYKYTPQHIKKILGTVYDVQSL